MISVENFSRRPGPTDPRRKIPIRSRRLAQPVSPWDESSPSISDVIVVPAATAEPYSHQVASPRLPPLDFGRRPAWLDVEFDSERFDIGGFPNAKTVCAYAGLAPVVRQSGGKKSKDPGISKQGSGLLRWALVEASSCTVNTSPKWKRIYERIAKPAGGKRAIVAVARKLLCVLYAMLRTMTPYRILTT